MRKLLIFGGGILIFIIILTTSIFKPEDELPAPLLDQSQSTSEISQKNKLVWGNFGPGTYTRTIGAKKEEVESLRIGGRGKAILKIETDNPEIKVSLRDENYDLVTNNSLVKQTKIDSDNKSVFIFEIKSDTANDSGKNWQLTVTNPNPETSSNYSLTLSEALPISAASTMENSSLATGGEASLSLTLEETISLNLTVPVDGATVTATITDPNGQTTTIILTENNDSPGVYTGTFENIGPPGIYQVVYTISGENFADQQFNQTVTDQFTVPDPNDSNAPINPNPSYQSTKKFDINQSDDIRLVN